MKSHNLSLYFGLVEDNLDPLKTGRVRVRVYGHHSENKSDIPTEDLPWASVTVNSIESGVGQSQVIPVGATALVYFTDPTHMQEPIVIGVLSGNNDFSKQATGTGVVKTLHTNGLFNEPSNPYATAYPSNQVISHGNTFIEVDGTEGSERIQTHHKSGSFSEFHPDGKHVKKIRGDDFEIILENKNLYVKGNLNIKVDGDTTFDISGDADIIAGKRLNLSASDNVTITGKEIHLNTGGSVDNADEGSDGDITDTSSNKVFVSSTEPETANEGDIWFDTSNSNQGHVYTDGEWEVTSNFSEDAVSENFTNRNRTIESPTEPDYYADGPFSNNDTWAKTGTNDSFKWNNVTQTWVTDSSVNFGKSVITGGLSTSISKSLLVVFNSTSLPSGANEGDLWFRRDVANIYRLKSNKWVNFNNEYLNSTFETLLQNVLDDDIKFHFSGTKPLNTVSGIGDVWVDGTDYYDYDGTEWNLTNNDFDKTLTIISFDTNIQDGIIEIFYSPTTPTPELVAEGDVWVDVSSDAETNTPKNYVYTLISGEWSRITDPDVEAAYVQAASYDAIQDGKINVYFDENIPDNTFSPVPKLGDLWFDISDEDVTDSLNYAVGDTSAPNTPNTKSVPKFDQYRFNGGTWVAIENYKISDVQANLVVETLIRNEQNTALAQQISTATTAINENETTVQQIMSSIDGIVGSYAVNFDVNGVVSGFEILTDYSSEIDLGVGNDGNYNIGEQVYVGNDFTTASYKATVVSWNRNNGKLKVISETGSVNTNDVLKGVDANAERPVSASVLRVDFGTSVKFDTNNFTIVDTANNSETTPFSVRNGVVYVGEVDTSEPQVTYVGEYATDPATNTFNLKSIYKNTSDNNTYILEEVGGNRVWNLFLERGSDGNDGTDGVQGPAGADGQTLYTWIAYADSADGTVGFSQNPAGKTYFGIAYNNPVQTESNNTTDYQWSLIKGVDGADGNDGADGADGLAGPAGTDGQPTYTWISYSNSADGSVDFSVGAGGTRKYIGIAHNKSTQTESTTYQDYTWSKIAGDDGEDGIEGPAGADGQPTYTWIKYADSLTGSGLTNSPTGKNYIGIAYNKNTQTESNTASDYTFALIKGTDGVDGADGIQGPNGVDGQPTYTWIKYADNASGGGLSNSSTNKDYIGIAYNKNTATESNNASDYTFSLFKGSDGVDGADGTDGVQGPAGANGERGSRTFYGTVTTAAWNSTTANNTISVQGLTKIPNDIVTLYNTSLGFSETRFWTGSSWDVVSQVIDGNLVVQGTIGADRIVAGDTFTQSLYVGSTNNLELDGGANRIVVSDGTVERVIIGDTDGNGTFGITINDDNGNVILNQGGVQRINGNTLLDGFNLFTDLASFYGGVESSVSEATTQATLATSAKNRAIELLDDPLLALGATRFERTENYNITDSNGTLNGVPFPISDLISRPASDVGSTPSKGGRILEIIREGGNIGTYGINAIPVDTSRVYEYTVTAAQNIVGGVNTHFLGLSCLDENFVNISGHGGGTFHYVLRVNEPIAPIFTEYKAVLTGESGDATSFPSGTKYVRFLVLANWNGTAGDSLFIDEIRFEDVTNVKDSENNAAISEEQAALSTDRAAAALTSQTITANAVVSAETTVLRQLPSTFEDGSKYFTSSFSGNPISVPDTAIQVTYPIVGQSKIADVVNYQWLLQKGVVEIKPNTAWEVTIVAEKTQGTTATRFYHLIYGLDDSYGFVNTDFVRTFSEYISPSDGEKSLRFAFTTDPNLEQSCIDRNLGQNNASFSDRVYHAGWATQKYFRIGGLPNNDSRTDSDHTQIRSISIREITSELNSENSAGNSEGSAVASELSRIGSVSALADTNALVSSAEEILRITSTVNQGGSWCTNPSFTLWNDGASRPKGWGSYNNGLGGGVWARETSITKFGDASRHITGAGNGQDLFGMSAFTYFADAGGGGGSAIFGILPDTQVSQYVVLDSWVYLVSGSWQGSGLYLNYRFSSSSSWNVRVVDFNTLGLPTGKWVHVTQFIDWGTIPSGINDVILYTMTNYSPFAGGSAAKDIIWGSCSVRHATDMEIEANKVVSLEASVTVNAGTLAAHDGRLQAHWSVETSVDGADAFIQAQADLTQGGVAASTVAIGATSFQVLNPVGGSFTKALDISNGQSTFYGDLQALGAMQFGTRRIPVALQSFDIAGLQDGDNFTFGGDLTNIPSYSIQTTTLAPLSTGQSYDVTLINLTSTGGTLRAKRTTSGINTTYTSSGSTSGTGSEPDEVLHKSSINDSTNGDYSFTVSASIFFTTDGLNQAFGFASLEFFVRPSSSGVWTSIGSSGIGGSSNTNGFQTVTDTFVKNYANVLGQTTDQEFGVSINGQSGDSVISFSVAYTHTSQSGTSSATPNGETCKVRIIPNNG